jgi:hypothetical protein
MVGVVDKPSQIPPRRGRPARHLLGGIAVCGVCGAATRVGTQNVGARQRSDDPTQPSRYRVYECAGSAGSRGFHVSMRQEHLDQLVTDAVLARISEPGFRTPRTSHEDEDGSERRALRLEIKGHRVWLDSVRKEADRRAAPLMLAHQERVVFPKIRAALSRIEALDELDPLAGQLRDSSSIRNAWNRMPLPEQRHIIQVLVTPRINPVLPEDRGRQGLNTRRVDLDWR